MNQTSRDASFPAAKLLGKRVVVTGAAGFIGTHLLGHLQKAGVETRALSRSPLQGLGGSVRFERADLSDQRLARSVFEDFKPDIVFHLAGLAAGGRERALVIPTFESNLRTSVNVLMAAAETGARVVLPGSLEEPDEPEALASSPYAMSKWAASGYGRMFHSLYGLDVRIARIFITYGPTRKDLGKLIPSVILSLLRGQAPRLSSGTRAVDWIHVDDVVGGLFALALAEGSVAGQTLDIGTGTLVPIRQLVEMIAAEFPQAPAPLFGALPERPFERVRAAALDRTRAAIGWAPTIPLAQGLRSTVAWFRAEAAALDPPQ